LQELDTGVMYRGFVAGVGHLQVIPAGVQVTPTHGQQLMQCKVGDEIRRFLLTAVTEKGGIDVKIVDLNKKCPFVARHVHHTSRKPQYFNVQSQPPSPWRHTTTRLAWRHPAFATGSSSCSNVTRIFSNNPELTSNDSWPIKTRCGGEGWCGWRKQHAYYYYPRFEHLRGLYNRLPRTKV